MINKYNLIGAVVFSAIVGSELKAQTNYSWSPAGPVLTAGRSRNVIIDKADATGNTLYIGSVSSGIFKSTDAGANWAPLNDQGTVRNISYLAQASDNKIYAATGEGFLRASQLTRALPGTGLYELNGTVLTQKANASVTGSVITRIACDPTNPQNIAIASNLGVLLSTDGGASFTAANGIPAGIGQIVQYDSQGNLYATATTFTNGTLVNLYKKTSGNTTFSAITPTNVNLPSTFYGRIEIGIAPTNPNVVYASCSKNAPNVSSTDLLGFFVSKDGGNTWTLILEGSPQLNPLSNGSTVGTGNYAHNVIVHPLSEDAVILSGYTSYMWMKTNGGAPGVGTWSQLGFGVMIPPNIHDVKIKTNGNSVQYAYYVTDAGVYRTADNFLSFQPFFKGLGTAQYNSISIARYPKTGVQSNSLTPYSGFIAGTGGNGLSYFSGNYPLVSNEINYISGDVYNAEFSKIAPNAAFFTNASSTSSTSNIYLTTDIKNNEPTTMLASHQVTPCGSANPAAFTSAGVPDFRGITNKGSITQEVYQNSTYSLTGIPFKLWETYGQKHLGSEVRSLDSVLFFNDTVQVLIPLTNTVQTTFTISLPKPQKQAIIDKVVIRTFTVNYVEANTSNVCSIKQYVGAFTPTMSLKGTMEFALTSPTASAASFTSTGLTANPSNNGLAYNAALSQDVLKFEFPTAPLSVVTSTANYTYMRVGATIFYKYNPGSKIYVSANRILSQPYSDSLILGPGTQSFVSSSASYSNGLSWQFANTGTSSLVPVNSSSSNPVIEFAPKFGARLAILNDKGVLVSKRPLNTNDPQNFQVVSCSGALTTNSSTYTAGQATVNGTPYLLDWAPNGRNIYYVTAVNSATPTYNVYKVNVSSSIYDFSIEDYKGKFYTGVVNGTKGGVSSATFNYTTNVNSNFRTTLIGTFNERVTSISVSDNNKNLLLTVADVSGGKRIYYSSPNVDQANIDNTVVTFTDKTGTTTNASTVTPAMNTINVYCGIFEFSNNNRVIVGTENGIYATEDITVASPTWTNVNNNLLPNVQIFDIKQQRMSSWDSYNSGIIYVATNGRGAWVNKNFLVNSVVGVNENEMIAKNTGLHVYPNPTNGNATLSFFGTENEEITINVLDISGKVVKSERVGKISSGYSDYQLNTNDLNTGVYIVNVSSSLGIKRVTKLIVTK